MLQAGRTRVRLPMGSLNFLNLLNPSSCTMALWFTQPLKDPSGGKTLPARKADNITAICEPIVLNISQPYRRPRPVTRIVLLLLLFYLGDGFTTLSDTG
jgi:hypothetical protein